MCFYFTLSYIYLLNKIKKENVEIMRKRWPRHSEKKKKDKMNENA